MLRNSEQLAYFHVEIYFMWKYIFLIHQLHSVFWKTPLVIIQRNSPCTAPWKERMGVEV